MVLTDIDPDSSDFEGEEETFFLAWLYQQYFRSLSYTTVGEHLHVDVGGCVHGGASLGALDRLRFEIMASAGLWSSSSCRHFRWRSRWHRVPSLGEDGVYLLGFMIRVILYLINKVKGQTFDFGRIVLADQNLLPKSDLWVVLHLTHWYVEHGSSLVVIWRQRYGCRPVR